MSCLCILRGFEGCSGMPRLSEIGSLPNNVSLYVMSLYAPPAITPGRHVIMHVLVRDWKFVRVTGSDVSSRGLHCAGAQQRAARGGAGGRVLCGGLRREALGMPLPGRGWPGPAKSANTGALGPARATAKRCGAGAGCGSFSRLRTQKGMCRRCESGLCWLGTRNRARGVC